MFIGNPNTVIFSKRTYPHSDCLVVEGGKVDLYEDKFSECVRAIYVKSGSLTGRKLTFDRNKVNIVSYEPTKVALSEINFNTPLIREFKLRGKLKLESFKNPFNGEIKKVTPKVLINLARELDSLTVAYMGSNQLELLKSYYEAYVPLFVYRGGIFSIYDHKLIELCKITKDFQCLKDYLPPLIKLYPENREYPVLYAKVLYNLYGKDSACKFIENYLISYDSGNGALNEFRSFLHCR